MEVQHGLIKMFGRVGDGEWCGLVFVCLRCVDRGFWACVLVLIHASMFTLL